MHVNKRVSKNSEILTNGRSFNRDKIMAPLPTPISRNKVDTFFRSFSIYCTNSCNHTYIYKYMFTLGYVYSVNKIVTDLNLCRRNVRLFIFVDI